MKINGQTISSDQSFRSYVDNIEDITTGAKLYNNSDEMIHDNKGLKDEDLSIIYEQTSSTSGTFDGIYQYSAVNNNWSPAPTQYLATDDDVMAVPYFGANGSSVGTLNTTKYFNDSTFSNIKNYLNKFGSLYNTLDTTNLRGIGSIRSILVNAQIINYLNIQNVPTFWNMFWNMTNLCCVDNISNWDVSNVTNMSNMFSNCKKLQFANDLVFSNWNVANVTDMSHMFRNCKILFEFEMGRTLPNFQGWNIANVTNTTSMFENCKELVVLNGFGAVNKDANKLITASNMFRNCKSLNSFSYSTSSTISFGFNMHNLIDASNMFADCASLNSISIMGDISSLHNASNMFTGCTNLGGININLDSGSVNNLSGMFAECTRLARFR